MSAIDPYAEPPQTVHDLILEELGEIKARLTIIK